MADYPGAITNFSTLTDNVDDYLALHQNERQDEIVAIETELGVNPKGSDATVLARLTRIDFGWGSHEDKSADIGNAIQATQDGIVFAFFSGSSTAVKGFRDISDGSTEIISNTNTNVSITFEVKKDEYYKVTLGAGTITIYDFTAHSQD